MSDVALDRGVYLADTFTEWYRERPFQIAFAASILIHALLIVFIPGLRSVQIADPQVLNVEIVIPEEQRPISQRQATPPQPEVAQVPEVMPRPELTPSAPEAPRIERQVLAPAPIVEPVVQPSQPEVLAPPQRAELSPPAPPEIPRPQPMTLPRPAPTPEQRLEIPVEPQPAPKAQPVPPTAAPQVARVEPRPQPQITPTAEPRPEPLPQPSAEPPPPVQPAPRSVAPVISQPRVIEPVVAVPPIQTPSAPSVAVAAPPAVAAPLPPVPGPAPAPADALARELTATYSQQISTQIKRHQKYPVVAQRRGWEGTAEVLLRIAPDGRVTNIALGRSTGRDILDKEALEMVRRATPLPQAPQQLRGRELSVTVPIIFRLRDS
jgi:protein TonB